MANLQRLLGGMLASGMGGRSHRGPAFPASPFLGSRSSGMGGFRNMAGLGALAYLGLQSVPGVPDEQPGLRGRDTAGGTAHRRRRHGCRERALGRSASVSAGVLGMGTEPAPEPEPAEIDDAHAMLLIRAMISRPRMRMARSPRTSASASPPSSIRPAPARTSAAVLERELQNPRSVDQIIREVRAPDTAEQVYLDLPARDEPGHPRRDRLSRLRRCQARHPCGAAQRAERSRLTPECPRLAQSVPKLLAPVFLVQAAVVRQRAPSE